MSASTERRLKPLSCWRVFQTKAQVEFLWKLSQSYPICFIIIQYVYIYNFLSFASDIGWCVLVHGDKARNRAVHGDIVVVELLPKSEWKGKVTALTEGQGEEKSGEDERKPMATGGMF